MFASPELIDSSHIVIYPLVLDKSVDRGYISSGGGERTSYWNLIFYNTETAQQHLLTSDHKILITSINLAGSSSSSSSFEYRPNGINIFKSNIIYTIISKDYNLDDRLDNGDPVYLYLSDKEGNGFRQISPDGYNIYSWEIVSGTSKIIMQGQRDENGDKKFDLMDNAIPLMADVTLMKPASEIFDKVYIDSLKQKLVSLWKK